MEKTKKKKEDFCSALDFAESQLKSAIDAPEQLLLPSVAISTTLRSVSKLLFDQGYVPFCKA